jgi:hypothetical protein
MRDYRYSFESSEPIQSGEYRPLRAPDEWALDGLERQQVYRYTRFRLRVFSVPLLRKPLS